MAASDNAILSFSYQWREPCGFQFQNKISDFTSYINRDIKFAFLMLKRDYLIPAWHVYRIMGKPGISRLKILWARNDHVAFCFPI